VAGEAGRVGLAEAVWKPRFPLPDDTALIHRKAASYEETEEFQSKPSAKT
jgi:hypothetical protein